MSNACDTSKLEHFSATYPSTKWRRNMERQYINVLSSTMGANGDIFNDPTASFSDIIVAFQSAGAPDDAKILARYQLDELDKLIQRTLRTQADHLEVTTMAHLEDAHNRINKALTST